MKKLFALLLTLVFVLALSACNNKGGGGVAGKNDNNATAVLPDTEQNNQTQSNADLITRDRAIELALKHAGLSKADVRDLEAELDQERAGRYWEVDFKSGKLEYSYDINAQTEEIVKLEKERD